jgi:two-component system, NtrC family, sensor kinase
MIKKIIYTSLFIVAVKFTAAQQSYVDSFQKQISITQNDTIKLVVLRNIARIYSEINPDSAFHYAEKSLIIARKLNLKLDEAGALREMGYAIMNLGNYPRSLQTILSALAITEDPKSEQRVLVGKYPGDDDIINHTSAVHAQRLGELAFTHQIMGLLYSNTNNYEKALFHHLEGRKAAEQSGNIPLQSIINMTMARVYLNLKKPDSALMTEQKAYEQAMQTEYKRYLGSILLNMGRIYAAQRNKHLAAEYYKKALVASAYQNSYPRGVVASDLLLAEIYKQSGKRDSSLLYIKDALPVAQYLNAPELLLRSYTALADYYKTTNNNDSAVKYQSLIIKINDSSFNSKQAQQFQNIDFDERQRQQQIETAKAAYRNKLRTYVLLAGIGIFLLLAIILLRNNRHKQKAYALLKKQKQETDKQKSMVEQTLAELKSTQAQLIQSEKMASLGELTAGIAHEIQNPLNFVNNFSEVNNELLTEMKNEIDKGNFQEAKNIAASLEQNMEKITFHGKRADGIVKGMLQHSRASSGQKELTDINALTDECLRLSYHGMRAKDKSFNVEIKTDFDGNTGEINIIPQDIGRVLLNLFTNAFYSVTEKKSQAGDARPDDPVGRGYEPTISVSTKKVGNKSDNYRIEIRVRDNGNGIPQKVLDKIFQPFFTTKPTGQGTGLGLSLSYDIVKAHGGELKVETKEGEGAEFIIQLPS